MSDPITSLTRGTGHETIGMLVSACVKQERITEGQGLRFIERLDSGDDSVVATEGEMWNETIHRALDAMASKIKETVT